MKQSYVTDNALLQGEAVSCCNQRLPSAEARAGEKCGHPNQGQHAVQSVLIRSDNVNVDNLCDQENYLKYMQFVKRPLSQMTRSDQTSRTTRLTRSQDAKAQIASLDQYLLRHEIQYNTLGRSLGQDL